MSWHRPGDKPLSEAMMTQFNDAYMRHSDSVSYNGYFFNVMRDDFRMYGLTNIDIEATEQSANGYVIDISLICTSECHVSIHECM